MTSRALATRYARALFDVSLAESDPSRVAEQLHGFVQMVAGHAELSRVIGSPAIPAKVKTAIVTQLLGQVTLESPLRKLLLMLANRDRLALLAELDETYQERLLQHQKIVEAHVTTAAPLPADRAEAIARGLAEKTGRQVKLTSSVDPALLGGVVARIGSMVFDGSVSRHLERLRVQLAQDA